MVAKNSTRTRSENEAAFAETLKPIPTRRWGEPDEGGMSALFLSSPMACYIAGQMLLVDGGITLM
ncbi:MAG: NAD(P)-dependent dehydrogenase (short-subunit alcohol dehydrogenase family) [Candidatus Azotimanducaceae bacterium]|jgi:NAD(P)-dependent dehydrogenase (short-subunit alcohol dehydrogenase family)